MSNALDEQPTFAPRAEQRDRGAAEVSQNATFGRARELSDAGYREMPDPASARTDQSFSGDYSGLSKAADDLAASRQPPSELVFRQYLAGDGAQADEREAVTLRRAAEDLTAARITDLEANDRARAEQIASNVDELRERVGPPNTFSGEDTDPAAPEMTSRSEAPEPKEVSESGIDPIVEEALKHPQVREAIEGEIRKADATRQNYDRALDAVSGVLRDVVFSQFPELKSDSADQFEAALMQLSQRDPTRYGQARALADRLSAVQAAQLLQQQQRDVAQRREFADYAKAEDARFGAMVKGEKPEVVQRVANEIIAYAEELGVPHEQFLQLCTTEPIMRNAAFQKMMFDAASYRLLQRARNEIAKKVVPAVQRPGVAVDARAALAEGDVRSLSARFANNPSIKNAAEVLTAQRRARS